MADMMRAAFPLALRIACAGCVIVIGACGSTTQNEMPGAASGGTGAAGSGGIGAGSGAIGGGASAGAAGIGTGAGAGASGVGAGAGAGVGGVGSGAAAGAAGSPGGMGNAGGEGGAGATNSDQEDFEILRMCPAEEPCAAVATGSGECPSVDILAALCAMEQLRDRTPTRLVRSYNECSAISLDYSEILVLPSDGNMAWTSSTRRYSNPVNNGTTFGASEVCTLKDASYFDDCAQELALFTDAATTFELSEAASACLDPKQWFASCRAESASCE